MSRQLTTQPREQGGNRYILVVSVQQNPEALEQYMERRGVQLDTPEGFPGGYIADYKEANKGDMKVMYHGRARVYSKHEGQDVGVTSGALLVVAGLEQQVVQQEVDEIIECMGGETEDPESVQQFTARLQRTEN